MENKSCIQLVHLSKQFINGPFGSSTVINDVSFTFKQGLSYAVTGISGSGKSTLLFLMAGLEEPSSGIVLYNELNVSAFNKDEQIFFLKKEIGIIFQKPHLIKELSVLENIMLKGMNKGFFDDNNEQALAILKDVGLQGFQEYPPALLSGGQQQRVAIARALYNKPRFILADEPTAHLDSENKRLIIELLISCSKAYGLGLIITTHDKEVSSAMDVRINIDRGMLVV